MNFYALGNAQITNSPQFDILKNITLDNYGENKVVTMGTCFAETLNKILTLYGVTTWFTVKSCRHYNSESLRNLMVKLRDGIRTTEDELFFHADKYGGVHPYQYHFKKRIMGEDCVEKAIAKTEELDRELLANLRTCSHLIITLGTNRVLRYNKFDVATGRVTGMPLTEFHAHDLDVDEVKAQLVETIEALREIRGGNLPNLIFTVSPLRYNFNPEVNGVGDRSWIIDNTLSKATLRVAVDSIESKYKAEGAYYFPSYEIVIDELRNFESINHYDHLHINPIQTPLYVIKRFLHACSSENFTDQITMVDKLLKLEESLEESTLEGLTCDHPLYVDTVARFADKAVETVGENQWNKKLLCNLTILLRKAGILETYPQIIEANSDVMSSIGNRKIVIWGTSKHYRDHYREWLLGSSSEAEMLGFIDSNPERQSTTLDGYEIFAPDKLGKLNPDVVIIASTFHGTINAGLKATHPEMEVFYHQFG